MSIIGIIIGFIAFIIGCIYAVSEFGFFLGLGLGWVPAFFIGVFAGIIVDLIITAIFIAFALAPMRKVYISDLAQGREGSHAVPHKPSKNGIEQRVKRESPKMASAYMLWALFGLLGAHRFYLGWWKTAILQALFGLPCISILLKLAAYGGAAFHEQEIGSLGVPIIWLIIDAFWIPGPIRAEQSKARQRITAEAVARKREMMRTRPGGKQEPRAEPTL